MKDNVRAGKLAALPLIWRKLELVSSAITDSPKRVNVATDKDSVFIFGASMLWL